MQTEERETSGSKVNESEKEYKLSPKQLKPKPVDKIMKHKDEEVKIKYTCEPCKIDYTIWRRLMNTRLKSKTIK